MPRYHFQISYVDKRGDCRESLGSLDFSSADHVKLAHALLDEYIANVNNPNVELAPILSFGGVCTCHGQNDKV